MWEKRKKLHYVPGLISALCIPIIFHFNQPEIHQKVVIGVYFPNDEKKYDPFSHRFSSISVLRELRKKKILQISLSEDHDQNDSKLRFFRHEARKIKYYNDTTTVIRVSFSNETTYGEVIDLLNILIADQHRRWVIIGNDFYIYGEEPPSPPQKEIPTFGEAF